ncbi:MAG: type II secretory pathway, component PulD [Opitutaceae bacterium]|nr:type II secretory pathway, component PulD [Opitutaceae bacterium]
MKNLFSPTPRLLAGVLIAAGFGLPAGAQPTPAPATASPNAPAPSDSVGPITLRDESIEQVLALLERWTGKTILRPQALPNATITLNLRGSVTREEAMRALETLLAMNGVAISTLDDKFLKVTALSSAKSEAPELITGSTLELPPSGRVASKVFQLNFLRISEFMPQVAGLLNPVAGSPPVVFEKANAALVTDSLTNLQRIETLVNRLDQPVLAGLQPKFYQLRNGAKASDVVNKMRTILSGALQNQIGTATSYNADDRTNQVILVADPRQHAFFDDLVAKLDVPSDPNTRNEVIYLKHAAAKDVATLLSQLVSGQNSAAKSSGQETSVRPIAAPAANAPAPGAAPGPAPAVATLAGISLESSNQFSSLLTILPEERSNSIVVSGTVDDIRLINDLVARIDVLLAQVRIEVVIAEVTLEDNATSGISELGLKVVGDKLVGFSGKGAGIGVTDGTITSPGASGSGTDLAATIALSTTPRKSNANILSVPNIITTHNKEGKIFVGEQRPVISSYLNDTASTGTITGSGYRSTVSSKDIGIDLTVKPLIGLDGAVQLEIKQEVNDVLGDITIDGNPQPRIGRRATESFVSVKSGEIIVLGGLQRTSQSRGTNRLGPIPIIGELLGTRTRNQTRTDLVFFLRPTVLTNTPADNSEAMRQVEQFPKEHRDRVKDVLASEPGS